MKSYKVHLKKIKLFGHHGVLKEEKENGQDFEIDIKYSYIKKSSEDNIDSALDYAQVLNKAKDIFMTNRYDLLENLADDIAKALIERFSSIEKIKVKITKTNPILDAEIATVSVSAKARR